MSVVIGPYIVYVYMYPICYMLVYTMILLLTMYLEGAKNKNKSGFNFLGVIEVIFWPPENPSPLYYMIFST